MELKAPTVADMIAALQRYDPNKPLRMKDADTGWCISVVHIEDDNGRIILSGEYCEMGSFD